jgi:hypothetical protein
MQAAPTAQTKRLTSANKQDCSCANWHMKLPLPDIPIVFAGKTSGADTAEPLARRFMMGFTG